MKVYKSKYRNHWISPYKILEKICFWEKDKDIFYNLNDEPNHKYEKITNTLSYVTRGIQWFLDKVHPRVEYVKIDYWDTWSMDHTLADIILPMLKQLKATQHGAPYVDDEDVPKELRSIYALPKDEYDTDGNHFKRWDWVLGEMIFAFEHLVNDDWEDEFHSGVSDWTHVKSDKTFTNPITGVEEATYQMVKGPNDTYKCDYEGMQKVHQRIDNGLRLFGKYYRGLWD